MNSSKPLTVLIGALGGEGGGVLAEWLTRAAESCGYPVQRTSIPGVAQRTGATTYYLEIVPQSREQRDSDEFVMALSPVPGQIDVFVASELLEAGRAVQNGLVSPARTTMIGSNHRIFTVAEKSAMGDGRYSSEHLSSVIARFAKRAITFDMDATARKAGTAISAVMLGAIAGADVLPLPRSAFEDAIRAAGKGVDASLKGFAAGFDAVASPTGITAAPSRATKRVAAVDHNFADDVQALVELGYSRQRDYQNRKYAERYLDRVKRIHAAERTTGAQSDTPVTAAVARFLALWMSYEDVIRVADLKARRSRMQRIRAEVGAQPDEPVRVIEYVKPGIEEWCAILPGGMAKRLRRWAERRGHRLSIGLHIRTTSLHGFLLLRLLAGLRWWRPYTSRFADEQALIDRWLGEVTRALEHDSRLALEVALCGRLIKGYGDTHARGKANFEGILDTLAQPASGPGADDRAGIVREAREAALADPEGRTLEQSLGAHGLRYVRPEPKPVPIMWHKSARSLSQTP